MTGPAQPTKKPSAASGLVMALAMVGGLGGTAWLVERGWSAWVVGPRCTEMCGAAGYDTLYIGGRGRGETACVCGDGSRIATSAPDVGAALGVGLGLVVAYGGVWLAAGRAEGAAK